MVLRRLNAFILLIILSNLLTALMLTANAAPAKSSAPAVLPAGVPDPEESAGMDEGDMVLTVEQRQLLYNPIAARNGLTNQTRRWPNRIVHYKIVGQEFEPIHVTSILQGIRTLEANTCIKFREADEAQKHYVEISSKPGGCFTAVGYQAKVQEMNLEPYPINTGCFRTGTILHEFMHALGFYHEQSSAERDEFIDVLYENIIPGKEFNFERYSNEVVSDFGVGYDYNSCLHYRPGAFSINGKDTIVPHSSTAMIGQRVGMSQMDIDKINVMYKCPIKV